MNKNFQVLENGKVVAECANGESAMLEAFQCQYDYSESLEEGLKPGTPPRVQVRFIKTGAIEWDSREQECSHPEFKVISSECTSMATREQPAEYYTEVSCMRCGWVGDIEETHCYAIER